MTGMKTHIPRPQVWASVGDNIGHRIYGYPTETNVEGKKTATRPPDRENVYVWRDNDFPYSLVV